MNSSISTGNLKDLSHVDVASNNKDPVRVSVWLGLCLG